MQAFLLEPRPDPTIPLPQGTLPYRHQSTLQEQDHKLLRPPCVSPFDEFQHYVSNLQPSALSSHATAIAATCVNSLYSFFSSGCSCTMPDNANTSLETSPTSSNNIANL